MPRKYSALAAHEAHARDPAPRMLASARVRARRRGLPCTISLADIRRKWAECGGVCPISGRKMYVGRKVLGPWSPSLDRRNNSLGYTPQNVRIVAHCINRLKGDATLAMLRMIVRGLEREQRRRRRRDERGVQP